MSQSVYEDEVPKHRRKKGPRPFTIEARRTTPSPFTWFKDWTVWGRYETARARDEAMRAIQDERSRRHKYEFRFPAEEPKP